MHSTGTIAPACSYKSLLNDSNPVTRTTFTESELSSSVTADDVPSSTAEKSWLGPKSLFFASDWDFRVDLETSGWNFSKQEPNGLGEELISVRYVLISIAVGGTKAQHAVTPRLRPTKTLAAVFIYSFVEKSSVQL